MTLYRSSIFRRNDDSLFKVKFTTTTDGEIIRVPLFGIGYGFSYRIDGGDWIRVDVNTLAITILESGTYQIDFDCNDTGFPVFAYGKAKASNPLQLTEIVQWGTNQWGRIDQMFEGCHNLIITAQDVPNISNITYGSMSKMFYNCSSITDIPNISNWVVPDIVTTMTQIFNRMTVLNQAIEWVTTNVTDMRGMFALSTSFNQKINFTNLTDLQYMFNSATGFNQDISHLDYSNVLTLFGFMLGKSSTNYDATNYDKLLIKWDKDPINGGLDVSNMSSKNVGMGSIQYTSAGLSAKNSLYAKGLRISDGGQV